VSELERLPIARPLLGDEELEAVKGPLTSGWVTQGPEVKAFEDEFAAAVGAPHAVAMSSCTTALHAVLHALGVGPGDEVVTVSHSYIATANTVRYCGATPVFADVDEATFNVDPAEVEALLTARTKALLVVHQMGMPCDLAALLPLAAARGLPVVEDAACAIGSELRWDGAWERVGAPRGVAACFSFHPRKLLTTGDGGMVTTRDPELDAKLRLLRHHGMSVADTARHAAKDVVFESYPLVGYNYRMTDIQASIGRVQLTRLDALVEERRRLAAGYAARLAKLPGFRPPHQPEWARSNFQSYCVRLPDGVEQVPVMQRLRDQGVATRRGIMNAHREPAYADLPLPRPLPRSEAAQDRCLLLPLFPGMREDQLDRVVAALVEAAS
jgi:dTDP-4-amino-4,6-dideoxygalactose transaminase